MVDYAENRTTSLTNSAASTNEASRSGLSIARFFPGGVQSFLRRRRGDGQAPNPIPSKPIRSQTRLKIEPKTSFANERTLMQWISAASLMITLATLIITSGTDIGFKAGLVFYATAFVIMIYAVFRYQYRAWSFRYRRDQNHDDLFGPVFLVVLISAAMGTILYMIFYYNAAPPVMVPERNSAEGCMQFGQGGVPEYFAFTDVAVDGTTGRVWASGPFAVVERAMDPSMVRSLKACLICRISRGSNMVWRIVTSTPSRATATCPESFTLAPTNPFRKS
jgi:uncharacterized membrane protein YidH (DUF202 family)